jgi:hypothetical protein
LKLAIPGFLSPKAIGVPGFHPESLENNTLGTIEIMSDGLILKKPIKTRNFPCPSVVNAFLYY